MFTRGELLSFLRCSPDRLDAILRRLGLPNHLRGLRYTPEQARAILAQFYARKGTAAGPGVEPGDKV